MEKHGASVPYKYVFDAKYRIENNPEDPLTATDLCNTTRMLKSQMNRTLNSMEEKGFITRERSTEDKRQVYVTLNAKQAELYINQHAKILKVLDAIIADAEERGIPCRITGITAPDREEMGVCVVDNFPEEHIQ